MTLPYTDVAGNGFGFGFGKAMPIRRRASVRRRPRAWMSSPSSRTSPAGSAPGISWCIRFRMRGSVDLPQPAGPISAFALPEAPALPPEALPCTGAGA